MSKIPVMLAKEYKNDIVLKKDNSQFSKPGKGWIMSEKFDGYRCLFRYEMIDNKLTGVFYSRNLKPFIPAKFFLDSMPSYELLKDKILDGELWAGRDNFQLMGTVRKKNPITEEWINITYQVYDIICSEEQFQNRLKILKDIIIKSNELWYLNKPIDIEHSPLVFTHQEIIKSDKHMKEFYKNIINNEGEGIMIKHPLSKYKNGRCSEMLKYKPIIDREGIIIGYNMGDEESKYKGKLGSFICRPLQNYDTYMSINQNDDLIFTLSGMDDEIRNNYKITHPIGTIITYECSGFTDKGVPRFGRYIRIRDDIIIKENTSNNTKLNTVLDIFKKLELYYKNNYDTFRSKSYYKVNKILNTLSDDSELEIENLKSIKGIGEGTINRIKEIIDTNTLQEYELIKNKKSPIEDFLKIHGVGKVHAKKLLNQGFKTIDDLQKCENIKDYLNDTQLKGLKYFNDIQQRIPYDEIKIHEKILKNCLSKIDQSAELTIAGSYRRKKSDSGDIDVLIKANNNKTYKKFIEILKKDNYLIETLSFGTKKFMGMTNSIIHKSFYRRIDIMFTKPEEYPFAVLYFTGSGEFNVKMREYALSKGYTINEYGINYTESDDKVDHEFNTEKDIFDFLDYEYLLPEKRI
tara:strand:+ start:74 stop:1969 length:1896 start_codon:yes stop_codon:yes gene_type:complete